jgi:hypothetical protein
MSDQGTHYSAYINAELQAELSRRESVNGRSATALTSSTGFVTLVLAVFAVFVGKDFILSGGAKISLAVGLFALLAAGICAVIAGFPWRIKLATTETLRKMVNEHWTDSEVTARGNAAYANVVVLESLRPGTNIKFWFLMIAGGCQIIAVGALGACTLFVVL